MPKSADGENHVDQVLVLRGLRAATVHKDFTLRAIGESGMASAAVSIPSFTTLRELFFTSLLVAAAPLMASSTVLTSSVGCCHTLSTDISGKPQPT